MQVNLRDIVCGYYNTNLVSKTMKFLASPTSGPRALFYNTPVWALTANKFCVAGCHFKPPEIKSL